MDDDNSKEGKKQPGEFTQYFKAYIPAEPLEPKPEEKPKPAPQAAKSEPPANYEPQRPERAVRIPLVQNPQELGAFTGAFNALKSPPAPPAPVASDAATRLFAAPVFEPLQQPSSGLDQAGTFRAFPAQLPGAPPSTQASEAEFVGEFSKPFPPVEVKVDWAAIESRPAPLPGPRAVGDFTQMFGRADIGMPSQSEGASGSSQAAKPEGPISSFTSAFSPLKMETSEAKMEAPAAAPVAKAAAVEPKQAAAAPKTQGPPLMMLAIVLVVILILAAAALYFFVLR
jgi:hypothetical protein